MTYITPSRGDTVMGLRVAAVLLHPKKIKFLQVEY
jgi:hypothetical protein